ncbi:MAG: hypothetical protein K2G67_05280 [Muribaculaceae bacterium]|nr:hypothetical protein [Muribaculaceae bacterium]
MMKKPGVWYGSQLRKGTDYLLEDGVTTFLRDVRSAVCLMKNQSFPDLDLFTDPIKVNISGVEQIFSDAEKQDMIYDLLGRKVTNPENGVYIVNGKKKVIK